MTVTSTTPSASTTPSTATPQIDYIGLLGTLSPTPFDPNAVINALLTVQQVPITNLQTQIGNMQTNESIYKNIAADVAGLQASAFNLTLQSSVQANTATSSNPGAVTATASPLAQQGTYTVTVNHLASATAATSTAALGQSIDGAAANTPLSGLNLAGTATGGSFSVVVDGKVNTVNVDPSKALLDPNGALTLLQAAITAAMAPTDPGAAAGVTVSGNKVSIGATGGTATHTISFGAAGDTSNFLSLMNLSTVGGTLSSGGAALTSSAAVGVTQVNSVLATGALATTLTGTPDPTTGVTTGSFTVNGVPISWNAGTDSLSTVIGRINSSSAGVAAQYNSVTDQLVLTNKGTGQTAINLADTMGNFLTAMNLAPGTTGAQILGSNASVMVNSTTVTSTSNTVTNAVPGLSITLGNNTPQGSPATITVGTDVTGITKQVQGFVDAANKVINDINLTQQKDPASGTYSQLLGDPTLLGLRNYLITTITGQVTGTGAYQSLQDIGITTGAVGSVPGTTNSLTLDTTKLAAALAANPTQVAALFSGTTAHNGLQGVAQTLSPYLLQQGNPSSGAFALFQTSTDAQIKTMQSQVTFLQQMIASQRQILTTQFSAMSNALAALSAQTAALSAFTASSSTSSTTPSTTSSSTTTTGG